MKGEEKVKSNAHRKERRRERGKRRRGISTVTGLQVLSCSVNPTLTILVGVCRGLPAYPVDTDFPILLWDLE